VPFATFTVYGMSRLTKVAKSAMLGDALTGSVGHGHAHLSLISDGVG
jgi:hypothetical protein